MPDTVITSEPAVAPSPDPTPSGFESVVMRIVESWGSSLTPEERTRYIERAVTALEGLGKSLTWLRYVKGGALILSGAALEYVSWGHPFLMAVGGALIVAGGVELR